MFAKFEPTNSIGKSYVAVIKTRIEIQSEFAAFLRREGFDTAVLMGNLLLDLPVQAFLTFDVKQYAEGQRRYENYDNYFTKNISQVELNTYIIEAYDIAEAFQNRFKNQSG